MISKSVFALTLIISVLLTVTTIFAAVTAPSHRRAFQQSGNDATVTTNAKEFTHENEQMFGEPTRRAAAHSVLKRRVTTTAHSSSASSSLRREAAMESFEDVVVVETNTKTESATTASSSSSSSHQQVQLMKDPNELVNVLFMHRHGARSSAVVRNGHPDWNGCVLSPVGAQMARSLGKYLSNRFKDWKYLPKDYNPLKVNSWSTDFERTIRTGTALLQSMFEKPGAPLPVAPYLKHMPQTLDFMLSYYYSWPAAQLHVKEILGWYPHNDNYTIHYFTPNEMNILATYLDNATEMCNETPTTCVIAAQDFLSCDLSNLPPGSVKPEVIALKDKLYHMYAKSLKYIYLSKPNSDYWRGIGYYAAEVIRDMMRKARASIAEHDLADPNAAPVIHHYSAHDITVFGLMVTLGVLTNETTEMDLLVPPFATLALFEIYRNESIRFTYATCNQTYGSGYEYTEQKQASPSAGSGNLYKMACMGPGGKSFSDFYHSDMCPMDDIERALNFSITNLYPRASAVLEDTMCYADPIDVQATNCSVNSTDVANASCQYYREYCPNVSCSEGWINGEILPADLRQPGDTDGYPYHRNVLHLGDAGDSDGDNSNDHDGDAGSSVFSSSSASTTSQQQQQYKRAKRRRYVLNETDTDQFVCVPIQPVQVIPRDVLSDAGQRAGTFIASMLLGIVIGATIGAFIMKSSASAKNADETRSLLREAESGGGGGGSVEPRSPARYVAESNDQDHMP